MTGKQATILIVDDEAVIRKLLKQKLSGEGYHCQEAGSADQALDKLRSNPVELVLLDIKMPGKSGIELLPEIKANYPDTAVIMATAMTDTSTAVQCMKQGAYDYVTKPFNLDEVALSVDRALEKIKLELENRDYQQHLEQRVAETSVAIAKELGMPQDDIERIRLAGLIHDIGKIGVRESVLNKPGKLTDEEFQHIKYHCETGERILAPIVDDKEILEVVRHHHERYDGTGYPDGVSGEQIPLGARILAVADTHDAMTSERPYREAMSDETACAEVKRGKSTQFDPEVADAFLRTRKSVSTVV